MRPAASQYETIVVGGGPAGTTAATVLADHGRRVLLLEKEIGPRYHIGESLIPYTYTTLERIGVLEKMRRLPFVKKYSAQFARQDGRVSTPFRFDQHTDLPLAQTWQVLRSEFDAMLIENAREHGAEVLPGVLVTELLTEGQRVVGVRARLADGETIGLRAPLTIDATGREALTIRTRQWRVRDPKLNKMAIWTYFEGARRDPGLEAGATTVAYLPDKGWFWYIPLHADRVSVGVVAEPAYLYRNSRDPATIMREEIENNLWIKEHLAPGRQVGQYWVTGEFSYRSRHWAADGLVLVGDALAFLDPVFSSGVMLALKSGERAADAAHAALAAGDSGAHRFQAYGETMMIEIERMRKLVYAFYDPDFSFRKFFERYPEMRHDLTDLLIGNVSRDFSELFERLGEFAELPQIPYHDETSATAS